MRSARHVDWGFAHTIEQLGEQASDNLLMLHLAQNSILSMLEGLMVNMSLPALICPSPACQLRQAARIWMTEESRAGGFGCVLQLIRLHANPSGYFPRPQHSVCCRELQTASHQSPMGVEPGEGCRVGFAGPETSAALGTGFVASHAATEGSWANAQTGGPGSSS